MRNAKVWAVVLCVSLTACDSEQAAAPVGDQTVAAQETEKRLVQLFGPKSDYLGRDLFFGNPAPRAEIRQAPQPVLPLLVGIVFQSGVPAAYFTDGGKSRTYRQGDLIAGRYRIVRIDPSFVVLEDSAERKTYRISLTGS